MDDTATQEKTFEVTSRQAGFKNVILQGTFTGPVTVEDIKGKFYHHYFGGRDAWVKDGRWGCTVHID